MDAQGSVRGNFHQRVALEGMVLKPNMVISGKKCPKQAERRGSRGRTIEVLKRCVPAAVPGIAFLSGGQSDEDATAHLNAMNREIRSAVAAHLLLRPRAAGRAAEGVVGKPKTSPRPNAPLPIARR
jgi:hypothetical protein